MEQLTKAITGCAIVGAVLAFIPDVLDGLFPADPKAWIFPAWALLRMPGRFLFGGPFRTDPSTEWMVYSFNLFFFSSLFYPLFAWALVWRRSGGRK